MRDDEMNEGIRKMLEKMSKKDYSDEELRDAEDTANSKYRSKLDAPVWDKVRLMFEVVKHPSLWGPQALMMATVSVIYLVSPIDVIPDLIPVAGLTDDVAVIALIAGMIFTKMPGLNQDRKMKIRETIPEDLRDLFDSLVGLK